MIREWLSNMLAVFLIAGFFALGGGICAAADDGRIGLAVALGAVFFLYMATFFTIIERRAPNELLGKYEPRNRG